MSRFWNFLSLVNAPDGKLPLVHATDMYRFRDIRISERLEPRDDTVYRAENLLYFFYGRPSYRPHATKNTVTAKALLPVCLVISPGIADRAVRVMPFDTGAFAQKMMHPPIHEDMNLKDFELQVAANAPMRIVELFYGRERSYFYAQPKSPIGGYDEFEDLEIDSYIRLIHHRANSDFDDRVTAVEIQFNTPVNLPGQVIAAVLPKPFLDKAGVAEQVERWGGIAIPYNVKEEFVPREIQGAIFDRLTDFFQDQGFLDRS
jgi:hypothetical protein